MKKKWTFGTLKTKKDAFIIYQKGLDANGRMQYLQKLRKAAYGSKLVKNDSNSKKLVSFTIKENESLNDFIKEYFLNSDISIKKSKI